LVKLINNNNNNNNNIRIKRNKWTDKKKIKKNHKKPDRESTEFSLELFKEYLREAEKDDVPPLSDGSKLCIPVLVAPLVNAFHRFLIHSMVCINWGCHQLFTSFLIRHIIIYIIQCPNETARTHKCLTIFTIISSELFRFNQIKIIKIKIDKYVLFYLNKNLKAVSKTLVIYRNYSGHFFFYDI
jgi:hypothetical protein